MVEEHLHASFFSHAGVESIRADVENAVVEGHLPPTVAAQKLIQQYEGH
jgi:LAO/AO transport system kinase